METTGRSSARYWPATLLAVAAVALVPWAIALNVILPSRHLADHWDIAWTGFDVILAVSLLATAYAAARRRDLVQRIAPVGAALLLCDVWFDVLTASTRADLEFAIVLAVVAEIPLAILCLLLAIGVLGPRSPAGHRLAVRRFRLL